MGGVVLLGRVCSMKAIILGFTIQIMAFYTYMEELPLTSGSMVSRQDGCGRVRMFIPGYGLRRLVLGLGILKCHLNLGCSTIPRMKAGKQMPYSNNTNPK